MTWASLVDRVLTGFPTDNNTFNSTKVKKYLEEAQEDFAFHTKCYEKNFSYYLDAGDTTLPMPKDFIEIISTVEFRGSNIPQFQRSEIISRRKVDNSFRTGTPEYFIIEGNNMSFVPQPTQAGLVTFRYVAKPTNLTDSATDYIKVNYDTLTSSAPYIGDTVGLKRYSSSTSNYTTAVTFTATVEEIEINNLTGTLTLSGVSSQEATDLTNNDLIYTTDDETEMWLTIATSWSTLIENWADYGLGFKALVNGDTYDFPTAGDEPQINQIYHSMLVDYAKAALYWELGSNMAPAYDQKYTQNREVVRRQYAHRGMHGPQRVADLMGYDGM